ncbi:hypothetical protein NC653_038587 [Populus alba x Populus x berolinensis]|uniref:Aldose 1-epimerase n=1 Tax=Populus alba x Populus x berolinensis TaxID=444605 RepID=A0AAD6LJU3_9ROSI|nr:hypothetical protein NC653_038587 [Populus alba x Populus x berolinensis]
MEYTTSYRNPEETKQPAMSTIAADAKAEHFELNNGTKRVTVTNYGATITSLYVPDKHGKVADVVLGFDSIEAYVVSFSDPFCFSVRLSFLVASAAKSCGFDTKDNAPYFGCIVGRVANRIKEGKFHLNGVDYSLPINNGPNSLHVYYDYFVGAYFPGGEYRALTKVVWDVVEHKDGEQTIDILFKYESYRGDVFVTATYHAYFLSKTLRLDMESSHSSGNVARAFSSDIRNLKLPLCDENSIPNRGRKVGKASIRKVPVLGKEGRIETRYQSEGPFKLQGAATCGQMLQVWQFYTANYVNGVRWGKAGRAVYRKALQDYAWRLKDFPKCH